MGEYGSCPARARFILAHIAQPCLHPAAANHHKGGRLCRHRINNHRRQPIPLSRAARAVRPNERAPLRGRAESPGGEPDAAASKPVGRRSRAAGGRGGPALRGGGYNAAPEPVALCAQKGECRHLRAPLWGNGNGGSNFGRVRLVLMMLLSIRATTDSKGNNPQKD